MFPSYFETREALLSGKTTCRKLVAHYLQRGHDHAAQNIFLELFQESATERARVLDEKLAQGKPPGRLFGFVIALKDNIVFRGHKCSASSRILEGFVSPYSATAVERLLNEDAIIIGRTNCDEFAMGSSNENSAFGPVLHPPGTQKVPGGSSGGSAAAVATGSCLGALGSDTGGSIRQPASFCGVVGLKPGYGRISRYGLIAYGSSFDQIGPLTHNVSDAALLLEVMAGADDYDSTASTENVPSYAESIQQSAQKKSPVRIGVIKACLDHPSLDKEIKEKTLDLINALKREGHQINYLDFPYLEYLVPTYYVLTTAEASSNLARYDGIRYGFRSPDAKGLEDTYKKTRSAGFGPEVKRRIMLGTFVLSSGYYDAYYSRAQKVRRKISQWAEKAFKENDLLFSPTSPGTAFEAGAIKDPVKMYLEDIYTVLANLYGGPAISLPLYKNSSDSPFGMQFMAKMGDEAPLLSFACSLEASGFQQN